MKAFSPAGRLSHRKTWKRSAASHTLPSPVPKINCSSATQKAKRMTAYLNIQADFFLTLNLQTLILSNRLMKALSSRRIKLLRTMKNDLQKCGRYFVLATE